MMANENQVANATNTGDKPKYDQPFTMEESQIMIFKNDRKTADKQPDYWGKAIVGGVEKRIGLWLKDSQTGGKFFSGNIRDYVPNAETEDKPKDDVPF
tara:strand:- start:9662 stop:9955 length:294 start_codon:yes stop_codon:yes gene_type:complete